MNTSMNKATSSNFDIADTWAGIPPRDGGVEDALWAVPQTLVDSIESAILAEAQAALAAGVIDQPKLDFGMAEARIRLTRSLVVARHYIMDRRTQLLGVAAHTEGAKLVTLAITAKFITDCFGDDEADRAHGITMMAEACASVGSQRPATWDDVIWWIL